MIIKFLKFLFLIMTGLGCLFGTLIMLFYILQTLHSVYIGESDFTYGTLAFIVLLLFAMNGFRSMLVEVYQDLRGKNEADR